MEKFIEWIDRLLTWTPFIILAALGGAANNTYQNVVKKQPFSGAMFLVAMGLAGFLGLAVAVTPLPDWLAPFRESLSCMLGFCAFPVMHIIETEFPAWLKRTYRRIFPEAPQPPKDTEN